jgi:hypothetical protein
MNRSIDRWKACVPSSMVKQSDAAIIFAFEDARHDILELADQNARLRSMLKIAAYPRRGTEEENMQIYLFAKMVQSVYTLEQLEDGL